MGETLAVATPFARQGERRGDPAVLRRLIAGPLLGLLAVAMVLLTPGLARADTSSSLTVVGTSDVSDSGLIAKVIQPAFQRAYPQYTFTYIGTATGMAITDAESGVVGASAMIVHAASLENQFVANGYSFEKYGRAIFTDDYVLGGPSGDPAGVRANAANSIAQALADIATAGINGGGTPKVTFVSRGGTPGTTVEEHKIWALVGAMASPPAGLLLCVVNGTSGGGETPIAAGNGVTASGQPCPNSGALPTSSELPAWYVTTGLTQGPNVIAANTCSGYHSPTNTCYVLSDRGTYDDLASGSDPAGSIPNLTILTRGPQSASAPGGAYALVNYFHAYVLNPIRPGEAVNLTAATDFLNLLTSSTIQAEVGHYLAHTSDPGGAPFRADASPIISVTHNFPHTYHAGKPVKITGTLTNAETGYPTLAGETVSIDEIDAGLPVTVASGKTNSTGTFSISFSPTSSGSYTLSTGQIVKIENSTLNPAFGDLLTPAATSSVPVKVQSSISKLKVKGGAGKAIVSGSVAPGTGHVKATVTVFAHLNGGKGGFTKVATLRIGARKSHFSVTVRLAAGRWKIKVNFQDPKQVLATESHTVTVTVHPKH